MALDSDGGLKAHLLPAGSNTGLVSPDRNGMYSWTRQFLQDQLDFNLRNLETELAARGLRRKPRDARMAPSAGTTRDEAREDPTTELTSR
jgi:hypothetical protein